VHITGDTAAQVADALDDAGDSSAVRARFATTDANSAPSPSSNAT